MNSRRLRWLLRFVALTCFVVAAGAMAWAWLVPLPAPEGEPGMSQPQVKAARVIGSRPVEDFSSLAGKRLRLPLKDVAPVAATPKPSRPPAPEPSLEQLGVQLIGTMLETGRTMAIFTDPRGRIDLKGSGETLELVPGGVTVQRIESGRVFLSYRGREVVLELERRGSL